MMEFRERLAYMMSRRGIASAAELSRLTGLTQVAIRNYMRGIKAPNAQALVKLTRALGVTADYLLTGSSLRPDRIPLLSKIPGGLPVAFTDGEYPAGFGEEFIDRGDVTDPNAFALIVEGDSMSPRINSGDIVIISPNSDIVSRTVAAVALGDDRTLKTVLLLDNGKVLLKPENVAYDPIIVDRSEVQFIGRVVERRERF
jgi:repressor LexA